MYFQCKDSFIFQSPGPNYSDCKTGCMVCVVFELYSPHLDDDEDDDEDDDDYNDDSNNRTVWLPGGPPLTEVLTTTQDN